jgi:hypothetical protein
MIFQCLKVTVEIRTTMFTRHWKRRTRRKWGNCNSKWTAPRRNLRRNSIKK